MVDRELSWRIDALSVFDGLCFASKRESDSIETEATVFLSAPHFEPERVVSLATANAASRRGFQAGLRDADGRELVFDSLDQIVECVRTAYRAGTQGDPDASPSNIPPARPPEGDPRGEFPPLEQLIEYSEIDEDWRSLIERNLWPSEAVNLGQRAEDFQSVLPMMVQRLLPRFVGDVVAADLAARQSTPVNSSDSAQSTVRVRAWIGLARRLGLDMSFQGSSFRIENNHYTDIESDIQLPWTWDLDAVYLGYPNFPAADNDVVRTAGTTQLPRSWRSAFNTSEIWTVSQAVTATGIGSPRDRKNLNSLAAVPLFAMGLLAAGAREYPFHAYNEWQAPKLFETVAAWATRSLTTGTLANHPAEAMIEEFHQSILIDHAEQMAHFHDVVSPDPFWRRRYRAGQRARLARGTNSADTNFA